MTGEQLRGEQSQDSTGGTAAAAATGGPQAAAGPSGAQLAALVSQATAWRHELHRHPELMYDLPWTSAFVADRLRSFGCDEVVEGIGGCGVVCVLRGALGPGPVRGLRADMDALPMTEETGLDYASQTPGKMHACGHDGHMAMLLGALKWLAQSRDFAGTIVGIFQPAEEAGAGAQAMIDDGITSRFGLEEIYGLHNQPGIALGSFAALPGPMLAGSTAFSITFQGRGCHAAAPQLGQDPVLMAATAIQSIQSIVSRNVSPREALVVSVTMLSAGTAVNILPDQVQIQGTIRGMSRAMVSLAGERLTEIAQGAARMLGGSADVQLFPGYPACINDAAVTQRVRQMIETTGRGPLNEQIAPLMAAEDFAYFLEALPGCFALMGTGEGAPLHSTTYQFNDAAIEPGIRYWIDLARYTGS